MIVLYSFFIFIIGASLGSFLKLVTDRYGTNESFVFKPSYCVHCKKNLLWWQNIPIFSYLFLGGKCFFCKTKIDSYSFCAELVSAFTASILYVAANLKHTTSFQTIPLLAFFMVLLLLSMLDLKHRTIPHEITYIAIVLFFLYKLFLKASILELFLNLGVAFLFMDFMYYLAMLFKKYEHEVNMISVPLIVWTIVFYFSDNIWFVVIPLIFYFVFMNILVSKRAHSFLWFLLFILLLFQIFKTLFVDLELADLKLYFSGIGVIYFIGEVLFYFFQRLFSAQSSVLTPQFPIAIGGGDITVLALISVFLGYKVSFLSLFIASLLAIFSHLVLRDRGRSIPFVPYITVACFIIILI